MEAIAGEWTLDKNENYDGFLKAVGVGSMKRSMIVKLGGSLSITCLPDKKVRIKAVNGPKTREKEITLDEEFSDETADGGTATGKMEVDGKALVAKMITKAGKNLTVRREVNDGGQLVQTMKFEDTECKRFYKKKK